MPLRYVMRVLVLAGLIPSGALALGLGDIHLKSALNAPLDADIDLAASADELAGLKVALASRESFSRYGLDYPAYLASVTLQPAKTADGHDVIRVHSHDAVTEPFATLLIEASWARGRLVREYTVLLDPPVFTGDTAAAATVAAPTAAIQSQSGTVSRPASAPVTSDASAAPPATAAAAPQSVAGGSYTVQRGDTLSNIAARNYPNSQRERALVALFRANPGAFSGNMNELRSGATLQLPDASAVAAIGPGEAVGEVTSQYRAWAPAHGGGQLRLVAPTQAPGGSATGALSGDTAALQQRVTQLQAELNESHRLLELRNAELARLQSQINSKQGAAVPPPAPPVAQRPIAQATPPEVAEPVPAEPTAKPVQAPTSRPVEAAKPAASESGSVLGWLTDNWKVVLGALAIVLGGVFGWRALRAKQSQEFDRTLDKLSSPPFEAAVRATRTTETQPIRALQPKEDTSFVVEESGTHEAPRISERDVAAMQASPVAVDDTVSGDTAVALDQGDPLAEADFHMAYGLYDQAADLVRIAIAREPQRRDLQLKLLEVFFVWGNKDQFLQLARELSTTRDQALSGEWEKIVIMGRQIAPDDALFAAGGSLPGAAVGGVDLNLEGGQNRVDFDLLGEPTMAHEAGDDKVDLDLGAALGDDEATGELRALGDTGVDFMLDDPARGSDVTGTTREMPQSSHTVTLEFTDGTGTHAVGEVPTVEQPRLNSDLDNPTIRQKLDATAAQNLGRAEQTAELALDDLGLDLSAATGNQEMAEEGADASPTMLTGLDDDTRTLLARAEAASGETAEMRSKPSETSGTWLFTDKDFSSVLPTIGGGPGNGSGEGAAHTELVTALMPRASETGLGLTNEIAALKGAGGKIDLNLHDLGATGNQAAKLDLDVGTQRPGSDSQFTETQRLVADTEASEPEPATMSEVGTKLDLARA
ncbi:MAG: FimV/HubP family polar landmark protein, partial [Steroidobacteraceae bacterium]